MWSQGKERHGRWQSLCETDKDAVHGGKTLLGLPSCWRCCHAAFWTPGYLQHRDALTSIQPEWEVSRNPLQYPWPRPYSVSGCVRHGRKIELLIASGSFPSGPP